MTRSFSRSLSASGPETDSASSPRRGPGPEVFASDGAVEEVERRGLASGAGRMAPAAASWRQMLRDLRWSSWERRV